MTILNVRGLVYSPAERICFMVPTSLRAAIYKTIPPVGNTVLMLAATDTTIVANGARSDE
jgi:hypothetical protein